MFICQKLLSNEVLKSKIFAGEHTPGPQKDVSSSVRLVWLWPAIPGLSKNKQIFQQQANFIAVDLGYKYSISQMSYLEINNIAPLSEGRGKCE